MGNREPFWTTMHHRRDKWNLLIHSNPYPDRKFPSCGNCPRGWLSVGGHQLTHRGFSYSNPYSDSYANANTYSHTNPDAYTFSVFNIQLSTLNPTPGPQ